MNQVGATDDADEAAARDDRQALDLVLVHQADDFRKRGRRRHGNNLRGHDLADLAGVGAHEIAGQTFRPDQRFQPARPPRCGAGLGAAQQIAFGDDPDHRAAAADDRKTADVMRSISRAACAIVVSGVTVITGCVMTSAAFIARPSLLCDPQDGQDRPP